MLVQKCVMHTKFAIYVFIFDQYTFIVVWVLFGYETSFCRWMCGYQQDTPTGEVIVQISTCVEKLPIRTKATNEQLRPCLHTRLIIYVFINSICIISPLLQFSLK
jgi:hypothetical protein